MSCWKDGSPDSPLLVVGMAPGREELVADRPFVGASGKLLWALAKRAGIDRSDCYILNTIGDWPDGSDGNPTKSQYDLWWDRFTDALSEFRGTTALLLGGAALWRITGLSGGIDAWRGYLVRPSECQPLERHKLINIPYKTGNKSKGRKAGDPRWVRVAETTRTPLGAIDLILPTLHPAGVIRTGGATMPLLAGDLERVKRALTNSLAPSRTAYGERPLVLVANDPPSPIAVDIETGGATADFSDLVRVGMADSTQCWSSPWNSLSRSCARETLADPSRPVIIHNAGFDVPRLAAAGAPVCGPIRDTMFAAALLQPDLKKGLNAAASLYLDCQRWKHESESAPAKYNALDAIREYELWQVEQQLLAETGQLALFTDVLMEGLPVLIDMGTRGIQLDTERRSSWLRELDREALLLGAKWYEASSGCNPSSPPQLKKLFNKLGMDIPYNKYGAESTDKQAMQQLKDLNPNHSELIDLLLKYKGVLKDIATYAKVAVGADGAVHPNFTPAFKDEDGLGKGLAGTWRPTAKEPNLQNQPEIARRMYVPREGHCFVGGDYSQLEARLLAGYSGDGALMEACNNGIHDVNAAKLGVTKTLAKNAFYGWSYLAGARTLHFTFKGKGIHVPIRQCQDLLDSFDKAYSVAAGFRAATIELARNKRYVENGFGLRRYFPQLSFPAPAAMATHIQSSGAMMMWHTLKQHQTAARSFGGDILLMVHDDVLWEVPLEAEAAAVAALTEIMTQPFDQVAPGFRCPITPKTSHSSWGELKPWNQTKSQS